VTDQPVQDTSEGDEVPVDPNLPWETTHRALMGAVKLGTTRSVKRIQGVDGMTVGTLRQEVEKGGRFVVYAYAISMLIVTLRRPSAIMFVPAGKSSRSKAIPYIVVSLLLGWWGIPWGPIFTPMAIVTDLKGGHDVTGAIARPLIQHGFAVAYQRRASGA